MLCVFRDTNIMTALNDDGITGIYVSVNYYWLCAL